MKRLILLSLSLIIIAELVGCSSHRRMAVDYAGNPQTFEVSTKPHLESVEFLTIDNKDATPLKADVVLSYDPETQCVMMDIHPKFTYKYTHVWLPTRNSFKNDIAYLTKKVLHARYKTTSMFRHDIKNGSGTVFETENCHLTESPKEQLFSKDDAIRYIFKVDDRKQPIRITFVSVTPVECYHTWLGNIKYKFHYIADPVTFKFKINIDPCLLPSNVELKNEVISYSKKAKNMYDDLVDAVNNKHITRCKQRKDEIAKSVSDAYKEYSDRFNGEPEKCMTIDKRLKELQEIIEYADRVKCATTEKPTERCTPNDQKKISKQIVDKTKALSSCNKRLRKKTDVSSNIQKGDELIEQVNKIIEDLSPRCRNEKDIKSAIESFRVVERDFINEYKSKKSN